MMCELKCSEAPSKLRAANDLTNIGQLDANIHEYIVEEKMGKEESPASLTRHASGLNIELQMRKTLDHIFPVNGDLNAVFYWLKITVVVATQQFFTIMLGVGLAG